MSRPVLEVPICACVTAARQLSTIFPIPSKYETEGSATSSGVGPALGFMLVRCGYCKAVLRTFEAFDFCTQNADLKEIDSISM